MAGLRKIFDTHTASDDEAAKQWMAANPSLDYISVYPCADGVKIWYCKTEEIPVDQKQQ